MTSSPTDPQIKVTYLDHMGDDLTTVNAARVSFNKYSDWVDCSSGLCLAARDVRLIEYLGRHGHDSPFNHNALSVHVKMPIFVARQLVKHEYLVLNEISRRYVDDPPEFYVPDMWRKKAENVKQGSSTEPLVIEGKRACQYCLSPLSFTRGREESDLTSVKAKRFCSPKCQGLFYRKRTDSGWASTKWSRLKQSARKRGIEFSITVEDLMELGRPKTCPYLEIDLDYETDTVSPNSPSINRVDPERGYEKGNLEIISNKANTMLHDASSEELRTLLRNVSVIRYGTFFHQAPSVETYYDNMRELYRDLIDGGLCAEQARMFMPQAMMTEVIWTGLLSAWAKMVNQRIQPDTQYETRLVAQQVDKIASELWPHSWKALRRMNL